MSCNPAAATVFVLNPGSTSIQLALFDRGGELWREEVRHRPEDLPREVVQQLDERWSAIEQHLQRIPSPPPGYIRPLADYAGQARWTRKRPVRLIGVRVSNLTKGQEDLFAEEDQTASFRRTAAVDDIRERFGKDSLLTGESVKLLKRNC